MIEIKDLCRSFGKNNVVDNLNLTIKTGEVFGFLGPNGAGKTTTVRMLSCLIKPTSGTAYHDGLDICKENDAMQIRKQIGILTETPGLYDSMSAYKNLDFYGKLYEVDENLRKERIEHYLKMLGLWEKKDKSVGGFSKGMKQKMAIARCLIHDPKVLFLDEPTSGLDPEASRIVRDFILELKKEGHTIFICTHNLDEADRLCDRIGIFRGTLLGVDEPSRLKSSLYGRTVKVQLKNVTPSIIDAVRSLNFINNVETNGSSLTLGMSSPETENPELIRTLVKAGADIQFVSEDRKTLEEVYFKVLGVSR
ncbi:multidrug ABC transporter ATP-binding protein [Methanocella sp. CWC-04]|uniref:Multidrug ABC transporter ATP-binding protein n=1 Tax=Methanooceanicella nereidis TaxID=2052831 RepID=A0AAP2W4L8_9EURY|nr:ABC transporter ATP-binding protein [Methanocella sp. CWC-04]MCD1293397.1 multidrug ABC transporter ATP-binding protein [Methanocella sp. CWC-04]